MIKQLDNGKWGFTCPCGWQVVRGSETQAKEAEKIHTRRIHLHYTKPGRRKRR